MLKVAVVSRRGVDFVDSSWLAGFVARQLTESAKGIRDETINDVAEPLWWLVRKWLGDSDRTLSELAEDPDREDWPAVLRDCIAPLLDERRVACLDRLLLSGQCEEALVRPPAGNPHFIGRLEERGQLRDALDRDPDGATAAPLLITGPPMIGKSQLAVHLAHEIEARYPNGLFVIDLGGPLDWSSAATDGLSGLLRAQGVSLHKIPGTWELALERYHSWFDGKQALVIIENAADAEQAHLFLPPAAGCAAIVTSTLPLIDLEAACHCELGALSDSDAVDLLRQLDRSGERAWTLDDPGAAEIVDWCGGHPAVLASVGAWMSEQRIASLSLTEIAEQLRQAEPSTDAPGSPELSMSLQLRYQEIAQRAPEAARLFRLLGLLDAPGADTGTVMALANQNRTIVEQALDDLVDARLLEREGSFRMPAMYRRFARDLAHTEEDHAERREALERALRYHLEREDPASAAEALEPSDRLADERTNLVSAVVQALAEGFFDLAWQLSIKSARLFDAHRSLGAWEATARTGLRAADLLDQADRRLEALAVTHANLADALHAQGQLDEAMASDQQSIQRVDDLVQLGLAHELRQDLDSAQSCVDRSVELIEQLDLAALGTPLDQLEADIAELRDRLSPSGSLSTANS